MPSPGFLIIAAVVVLLLLVIVSNIYVVQQSKAYVVERLGAFYAVMGVGIHVKLPFVQRGSALLPSRSTWTLSLGDIFAPGLVGGWGGARRARGGGGGERSSRGKGRRRLS